MPVERLHILKSELGPRSACVLIRGCKSLRTFHYTFGKIDIFEEHFRPLEVVQLLLNLHGHAIEELTMLYDGDCVKQVWYDLSTREWYMGTELRKFNNLKSLRSGMHSLLGLLHPRSEGNEQYGTPSELDTPDLVDVLPGSLEQLTILYTEKRTVSHLQKLSVVREQRFPTLKKITIGFCQETTTDGKVNPPTMEEVELTILYQSQSELATYVYDREPFSWLGIHVLGNQNLKTVSRRNIIKRAHTYLSFDQQIPGCFF